MEEKEQSHVSQMDFEWDILDKAVETGKALTKAELDRSTTAFMTLLFERFNVMSQRERADDQKEWKVTLCQYYNALAEPGANKNDMSLHEIEEVCQSASYLVPNESSVCPVLCPDTSTYCALEYRANHNEPDICARVSRPGRKRRFPCLQWAVDAAHSLGDVGRMAYHRCAIIRRFGRDGVKNSCDDLEREMVEQGPTGTWQRPQNRDLHRRKLVS